MNKKRVILVHGFNVRDRGKGTTDKLGPMFKDAGFSVVEFDTGWRGLLMVRFGNWKRAEKLATLIQPGDLLVGHSDGCSLINRACWSVSRIMGKTKLNCIYLNPAMDADTPLSPIVLRALVFYTKSDKVVWLSKFLLFHKWGKMGMTGYKDKFYQTHDGRYENCSYESVGVQSPGHSGVFKKAYNLDLVFKKIKAFLNA